ncbi:MAG TPA: filamentous hemagglutinin N-terminal domain-containing protein, partial [Stellaceae bacterium]|nr:filamentous hemagglutinin N-terminal domain-containing protein [Stellaceae bacterium]
MTRRMGLAGTTALCGVLLDGVLLGGQAWALPQGGHVTGGQAVIEQVAPHTLEVIEQSKRVTIDWTSFNLAQGDKVIFLGPGGAVINDVTGGQGASFINGALQAAGLIGLSNPAGIYFGPQASVNVGSLIATTAAMSAADRQNFLQNGAYAFSVAGKPSASVVNQGSLTIAQNGLAALVAPGVENSGVITARLSKVALASADKFFLDFYGDRLVNLSASSLINAAPLGPDGKPLVAAVVESGKIVADGGTVELTANAARAVVNSAINLSGTVDARSAGRQGGDIVLDAGPGLVEIDGVIDASGGAQAGGRVQVKAEGIVEAGTIDVSGHAGGGMIALAAADIVQGGSLRADGGLGIGGTIALDFSRTYLASESALLSAGGALGGSISAVGGAQSGLLVSSQFSATGSLGRGGAIALDAGSVQLLAASLDASGAGGGGTVAIGGAMAASAAVSADTRITADASLLGTGGHITVLSGSATEVAGALSARGGAVGGDGGLIEISTRGGPAGFAGTVTTAAPHGRSGTLLLDPTNITIADDGILPQFNLTHPEGNLAPFGGAVQVLANGNIAVADIVTSDVFVFNGKTGGLMSTLVGAGFEGFGALTNGNFIVLSNHSLFVNGSTPITAIAGSPAASSIPTLNQDGLGAGYLDALRASGNPFLVGFANGVTPGLTPGNNPAGTLFVFGVPGVEGSGGDLGLINFKALPNGGFVLADNFQTIFGNGAT